MHLLVCRTNSPRHRAHHSETPSAPTMAPNRGDRERTGSLDALSAQMAQARLRADDLLEQAQEKVQQPIRRIRSGFSDLLITSGVSRTLAKAGQDTVDRGSANMQMLQHPPHLTQSLRAGQGPRAMSMRRVRSAADLRGSEVANTSQPRDAPRHWAPMESIPSQELQQTPLNRSSLQPKFPSVTAPRLVSPRQVSACCPCKHPSAHTADCIPHLSTCRVISRIVPSGGSKVFTCCRSAGGRFRRPSNLVSCSCMCCAATRCLQG